MPTGDAADRGQSMGPHALRALIVDERGQDLIEYALMAGFVSTVCFVAIKHTGRHIGDVWEDIERVLDGKKPKGPKGPK